MTEQKKSGFVAVLGRPNVGKSTLVNQLVGAAVSLVTRRAQTTQSQILGIETREHYQIIYVDTPGVNRPGPIALHQRLNREAHLALIDADAALLVCEPWHWCPEDEWITEQALKANIPIHLVVNKIDQMRNTEALLAFLRSRGEEGRYKTLLPVCARRKRSVALISERVAADLPAVEDFEYPESCKQTREDSEMVAEMIRGQLLRVLSDELPYCMQVQVLQMVPQLPYLRIEAVLLVQRDSQKAICIGQNGQTIKRIGQRSRILLEKYFKQPIYLDLWVRVNVPQ